MLLPAGARAQASSDADFLKTASQSDFTEITFSQLAETNATNPKVKMFAEKMVSDHTMLESNMKPFADKLGVQPVTTMDPDHQAKYDQLKTLTGADFDKTYMADMDKDHHVALTLFQGEESSTTDPAMKKTVMKGEKVVAQHTAMADKLSTAVGTPAM